MEKDNEPALEQPGPRTDLGLTELELSLREDEFVEFDGEDDVQGKKLIETKVHANHYCVVEIKC